MTRPNRGCKLARISMVLGFGDSQLSAREIILNIKGLLLLMNERQFKSIRLLPCHLQSILKTHPRAPTDNIRQPISSVYHFLANSFLKRANQVTRANGSIQPCLLLRHNLEPLLPPPLQPVSPNTGQITSWVRKKKSQM